MEKCTICGRQFTECAGAEDNDRYVLTFKEGVCWFCGDVLWRAFGGIVEMLSEAHSERRERVAARLLSRLEHVNFEMRGESFRRSA